MTVFGRFLGPWLTISCQKRSPCFDNFPLFLLFCICPRYFHHVFSLLDYNFCLFGCFITNTTQYTTTDSTQQTQHTTHNTHALPLPISVVFLAIHDKLQEETLVKASSGIDTQIIRYTSVLRRKTNRTISQVVPLRSFPLDTWSSTALPGKGT